MKRKLSRWLSQLSTFFAHRKGLLPILGIMMIILNFILRLTTQGWLEHTDFFLHAGVVTSLIGLMLYWAL